MFAVMEFKVCNCNAIVLSCFTFLLFRLTTWQTELHGLVMLMSVIAYTVIFVESGSGLPLYLWPKIESNRNKLAIFP